MAFLANNLLNDTGLHENEYRFLRKFIVIVTSCITRIVLRLGTVSYPCVWLLYLWFNCKQVSKYDEMSSRDHKW